MATQQLARLGDGNRDFAPLLGSPKDENSLA
jgi:hypothetical protein